MIFDVDGLIYQVDPMLVRASGYLERSKTILDEIKIPEGFSGISYINAAKIRLEDDKKSIDSITSWLVGKVEEFCNAETSNFLVANWKEILWDQIKNYTKEKSDGVKNYFKDFLPDFFSDIRAAFISVYDDMLIDAQIQNDMLFHQLNFDESNPDDNIEFKHTTDTLRSLLEYEQGKTFNDENITTLGSTTLKVGTGLIAKGWYNTTLWGIIGYGDGVSDTLNQNINMDELNDEELLYLYGESRTNGVINGVSEAASELTARGAVKAFGLGDFGKATTKGIVSEVMKKGDQIIELITGDFNADDFLNFSVQTGGAVVSKAGYSAVLKTVVNTDNVEYIMSTVFASIFGK